VRHTANLNRAVSNDRVARGEDLIALGIAGHLVTIDAVLRDAERARSTMRTHLDEISSSVVARIHRLL
jgi:DNA-binding GntR family transcriptional regulator